EELVDVFGEIGSHLVEDENDVPLGGIGGRDLESERQAVEFLEEREPLLGEVDLLLRDLLFLSRVELGGEKGVLVDGIEALAELAAQVLAEDGLLVRRRMHLVRIGLGEDLAAGGEVLLGPLAVGGGSEDESDDAEDEGPKGSRRHEGLLREWLTEGEYRE